jgi:hypothetical protein
VRHAQSMDRSSQQACHIRATKCILVLIVFCACSAFDHTIIHRDRALIGNFPAAERKLHSPHELTGTIQMDCTGATSKYPCTQMGLEDAVAAAGVNGTVIVPAHQTISVTSGMSLSVNGLTFRCQPGATLLTAVQVGNPFYIGAVHDVTVEGCHFRYSSGVQVALVISNSAVHVHFSDNIVDGYPAGGANIAIAIGDRTNTTVATANADVSVEGNVFIGDCGNQIDVADYNLRVSINSNLFLPCAAGENNEVINAQTTDSGTVIQALHIQDNMMWNESGGDCVQVQPLSGGLLSITEVTVTHNVCVLMAGGGSGTGYSLSGEHIAATANLFTSNGESFAGDNPPFEIINCVHCSETRDVADMGNQSGPVVVFSAGSINTGNSIDDKFTGNVCRIAERGAGSAACFMAGASSAGTISGLNFSRNIVDMSGSTSAGMLRGIWIQCNNAAAGCVRGTVSGNDLKGPNGKGTEQGVVIERDAGTMSKWIVDANFYSGWPTKLTYTPGTIARIRSPLPVSSHCKHCAIPQ